jgi:ABC-type molybdate transport system ATPase subunit
MCAIGRALMANPKMVLLDEPSMGLAPQIVEEVFEIVKDLNQRRRSPSCWPSRTPTWRCATPTSATSSKTAAS